VPCAEWLRGHPRAAKKVKQMKSVEGIVSRRKSSRHVCSVCGKPSIETICDPCAMKIHLDALARKTHEENGASWAKWGSPDVTHKQRH